MRPSLTPERVLIPTTAATCSRGAERRGRCYPQVGKGTQLKLVVNMVMGTQLAALAEGVALGRRLGLEPKTLQEVLEMGAMSSPMCAATYEPAAYEPPSAATARRAMPVFPIPCRAAPWSQG